MLTRKRLLPSLTKTEKIYLLACFSVYAVWALVFVCSAYGADEMGRYDIPKFIAQHNALPYGWEEEIRSPIWGFSYGFSTAFPYWLAALFIKVTSHFTDDWQTLILAARLTSALSMTGVAFYAILLSKKLNIGPARWMFIALMSLPPQMVYLGSYYNLDSFSLFTAMMIVYAWSCCLESEWSRGSCIRLAIGIALCFISYEFAYSFILGSFLLYCIWHLMRRKQVLWKKFFGNGFLILGIVFAISGWVFIRNAILYDGDITGLNMRNIYGELYAIPELKPSLRNTYAQRGLSMLEMLKSSVWISFTTDSTVSVLGYMVVRARKWVYAGYRFIAILGGVGLLLRILRKKVSKTEAYILASLLFCAAVTVFLSVYYSWCIDFQPQGRYIITAMIFVWFAALKGFQEIFDGLAALTGANPQKVAAWGAGVVTAFVVLTSAEAFTHCLEFFIWHNVWA